MNIKESISERIKCAMTAALIMSDKVVAGETSKKEYYAMLDEILSIAVDEVLLDVNEMIFENINNLN